MKKCILIAIAVFICGILSAQTRMSKKEADHVFYNLLNASLFEECAVITLLGLDETKDSLIKNNGSQKEINKKNHLIRKAIKKVKRQCKLFLKLVDSKDYDQVEQYWSTSQKKIFADMKIMVEDDLMFAEMILQQMRGMK